MSYRSREACDLLVLGAGAKATAIAAKVHALNTLGHGPIRVTIVEARAPAASWLGLNGMTSGDEPLAVTPIKDVGFPYRSGVTLGVAGEAVDRALVAFSWQAHLIEAGTYARWVDAGTPQIRHRQYGEYLRWALARATDGVELVHGRAISVRLKGDEWAVEVAGGRERSLRGRALLITGPGIHRHLPHDRAAAPRLFHCDSSRTAMAAGITDEHPDVAILGGGESALSALMLLRGLKPTGRFTLYTPGLPLSRGESFLENRVFSEPDTVGWSELSADMRREFVKHCDRGVFDAGSLAQISSDARCHFVVGRIEHVSGRSDASAVWVEYDAPSGRLAVEHGYAINCTGFDVGAMLFGLLTAQTREEIERRCGLALAASGELPIGPSLELAGLRPRLHVPALAGVSQGPGFANLGCLGLVADRVLAGLVEPSCDSDGGRRCLVGAGALRLNASDTGPATRVSP